MVTRTAVIHFIDTFKYGVSCEGGTPTLIGNGDPVKSEIVDLALRYLHSEERPISKGDKTGWEGSYSDDLDIDIRMPSSGTECTISGYTNQGAKIKWVYKPEMLLEPNTTIVGITGIPEGKEVKCSDSAVHIYTVTLENSGKDADSGSVRLKHIPGFFSRPRFSPSEQPYSLEAGKSASYSFEVKFPSSLVNITGFQFGAEAISAVTQGYETENSQKIDLVGCQERQNSPVLDFFQLLLLSSEVLAE